MVGVRNYLTVSNLLFYHGLVSKADMAATALKNFEIPPEASSTIKAKCKHCGTIISGNRKTTSNFVTHMKVCEKTTTDPRKKTFLIKATHRKATEIQNQVKKSLSGASSVCLTLDLWTNRQMPAFIGITGHFITEWELKSVMVSFKRIRGSHTAENIRFNYEETTSSLEISDKVFNIITDNASNLIKAFKISLPGFTSKKSDGNYDSDDDDDDDDDGAAKSRDYEYFDCCIVAAMHTHYS